MATEAFEPHRVIGFSVEDLQGSDLVVMVLKLGVKMDGRTLVELLRWQTFYSNYFDEDNQQKHYTSKSNSNLTVSKQFKQQ